MSWVILNEIISLKNQQNIFVIENEEGVFCTYLSEKIYLKLHEINLNVALICSTYVQNSEFGVTHSS